MLHGNTKVFDSCGKLVMLHMGFSRRIVSLFQAVYRNSTLQNNNSGIMHWFSVFVLKTGIVILFGARVL